MVADRCVGASQALRSFHCGTLPYAAVWLQVKGEVTIKEFSSIDPDEYAFEVSMEKEEEALTAATNLKLAVQGLEKDILKQLQQYVAELNSHQ